MRRNKLRPQTRHAPLLQAMARGPRPYPPLPEPSMPSGSPSPSLGRRVDVGARNAGRNPHTNRFVGSIPSELGQLTQLRFLYARESCARSPSSMRSTRAAAATRRAFLTNALTNWHAYVTHCPS